MSSVKYDSSNYDAAKEKYEQLERKYAGKSGIDIGRAQGSNIAETAGKSAVQSATSGARSAGMNKAQAALAGMGAGSKAASDNYGAGTQMALNKQQNELSNRLSMTDKASQVDQKKYEGKVNQETAKMGAISSGLKDAATVAGTAIAAMASDETLKNLDGYAPRKSGGNNTVVNTQKVGRNEPCPCGSGKKYKNCCGK